MANYTTSIAFTISATRADAERFIKIIEAATALAQGEQLMLHRDITAAFLSNDKSPEDVLTDILDDGGFGLDCRFDEPLQTLTLYDTDGAPNLWALAHILQRLYVDMLPLGFIYTNSCDKARPDGVGGGLFAITSDAVVHRDLGQILQTDIEELRGAGHGD
jgi:hypothetical protein